MNEYSEFETLRIYKARDDSLCVEVFRRPNGTFGFEEYREPDEKGQFWIRCGNHDQLVYESEIDAVNAAIKTVYWLPHTFVRVGAVIT